MGERGGEKRRGAGKKNPLKEGLKAEHNGSHLTVSIVSHEPSFINKHNTPKDTDTDLDTHTHSGSTVANTHISL